MFIEKDGDIIYDKTNNKENLTKLNGSWHLDSVFIDGTGHLSTPTPPFGSSGSITMMFGGDGTTAPAGSGKFFVTVDAEFQLFRNGLDTSLSFFINGVHAVFTTPDLYNTGIHILTATWDDTRNIRQLFVDGIKLTSVTDAFAMPALSSTFYIGNRADIARSNAMRHYFVYYHSDVLIDAVVLDIHRDSFAMFQQNRVRRFSVTGGIAVFANISDGLGISDIIVTKTGYIRSVVDNIGISDVLTRIATYIRALASNLATTDTINTARNLKRSMPDNVGVTDTVTTKKFVLVALSDNLGITDVVTRIITFFRSIPDTLAISDTLTTIRTISRSIADGVGITDVLTSEKFILVAIADGVGLTDVIATIGTFIRSVADGVGITDVVTRIGTFIRSESDNVGVSDTVTASKGVSRTITDGVGITDVIAAVLGKLSSIADSLGITDVLTFIRTTVVGGRVFIAGVAKSLRISGRNKSLTVSGEDKSLKISGSGD